LSAIDCTGTDNKTRKQNTAYTKNTKEKQITTALDNKNYTVVWYAVYDLRPGNGAGLILTAPEPTWYSERVGG